MKIGYARVSTDDQNLDLQEDALRKAGCERIFTDRASGTKIDRRGLEQAMETTVKGDVLVVWKLDRLGRSLAHLVETASRLKARGVAFASLTEGIDTATACGEMIYNMLGAIAQFERRQIIDRTKAGLAAARARGRLGGRPFVTPPEVIRAAAAEMQGDGRAVCAALSISMSTYSRAMKGV